VLWGATPPGGEWHLGNSTAGKWVSFALLLAACGVGAAYAYVRRDQFAVLLNVPLWGVLLRAVMGLVLRGVSARNLQVCTREMGSRLSLGESYLLSWATVYWNYIPVKPGTGALAVYLKKRHGLPYAAYASYVAVVNLLRFLLTGVLGFLITLPMSLLGELTWAVPAVFAALGMGAAVPFVAPSRWSYRGDGRLLRALSRFSDAWNEMRARRLLLLRVVGLQLAGRFLGAATILLCFRLTGVPLSYLEAFVVGLLRALAGVAAIVPEQLVVREVLAGAAAVAFGFTFAQGVVATVLDRAVALSITLLLGPIASYAMGRRLVTGPDAAGTESTAGADGSAT